MSNYIPDSWVIIRVKQGNEIIDKILAGWFGGYLHGDSWKINSGIKKITELDKKYQVEGYSGSTYDLYKDGERLSSVTFHVLASLQNNNMFSVEQIEIKDILDKYK